MEVKTRAPSCELCPKYLWDKNGMPLRRLTPKERKGFSCPSWCVRHILEGKYDRLDYVLAKRMLMTGEKVSTSREAYLLAKVSIIEKMTKKQRLKVLLSMAPHPYPRGK